MSGRGIRLASGEHTGRISQESSLVCACDRMDDEWLARMAAVEEPPRISFVAGDYGQLPLAPGAFDLVLVNGTADFTDPGQVLKDARRLAAEDGILLCYSEDAPLLRDTFRLFFEPDQREEYEIDPFRMLQLAKAADQRFPGWDERSRAEYESRIEEHLTRAEAVLAGKQAERTEVSELRIQLLADAKEAAFRGDVKRKVRAMEVREKLM